MTESTDQTVPPTAQIPFHKDYAKNWDRHNSATEEPCIICGKGIKVEKAKQIIYVDLEVNDMLSPEEVDRRIVAGRQGDQCCYFYVGPDCAKRADVAPYVRHE